MHDFILFRKGDYIYTKITNLTKYQNAVMQKYDMNCRQMWPLQ
jgi:hypothetical protein